MRIQLNDQNLDLKYLILDYNGTIACGGKLLNLQTYFQALSKKYKLYILTGNTFSNLDDLKDLNDIEVVITPDGLSKQAFIHKLGPDQCMAVGNGNIDVLMFQAAALSIAVIGCEGCSSKAILNSDLVTHSIEDAFSLLLEPNKLIATLRR